MTALDYALERTILISAARSTVFRYFKDSERFAAWWGAGSRIEGRPGGTVLIRYPNGVTASGQVLEIVEGERVVFSFGYDEPGKPIPPGGSRVTITLRDHPTGTRLHLKHEVTDAAIRDHHVAGWRYQLALFANVAAGEQHQGAAALVDRYFGVWAEPEPAARRAGLASVVGRDDLLEHITAVQMHMPGVRLVRAGEVRQCQGTAVVDWVAQAADGPTRGSGTNVFDLGPDGRIGRVVGLRKT